MGELRCYCFIDSLQPQFASFLGTVAQGFLPVPGQASLFVEVAPGMDIMKVTDVALKATDVKPGMMIIERLYGMLEVHSESQADVRQAGAAILAALDLKEEDRIKPEITSRQVIRNISDYHTQLINRTRHGDMIVPGETLYVLECAPAGYAAIAANEAEKAAHINVLEVRAFGPDDPRDFYIFRLGAELAARGENPYDVPKVREHIAKQFPADDAKEFVQNSGYFLPPLAVLAFMPFAIGGFVVNLPTPARYRINPYVLAEGGALVFDPTGNSFGFVPGAQKQTVGVFTYGAGADFPLFNHVALRAEYRGLVYNAPDFGITSLNTNTITHAAQPSAGVVFRF